MKLSTKIILPIILISALLILLTGCFGVPTDEEPGYTPGTITGIIASPCCSTSAESVSETCCIAPEYWCFYCQKTWSLQDGIEVVLTYGEDEVATVFTNKDGEFTFTNVDPGKNYVVTAYCPDFADNRPLIKDVALELIEGGSFDTDITDLVSTSLGLVVDFLVLYTEWGPEDISLDEVLADRPNFPSFPKFKKLVYEVRRVVENCEVNLLTDDDVQDALCRAAEEISKLDIGCGPGYTPPPPPPPGLCDGNLPPIIDSVESNSLPVIEGSAVNLVLGESYDIVVTAHDQDSKLGTLTYFATVDGVKSPVTTTGQVTVEPTLPGTYEVYLFVNDGCIDTRWGPVTVVVCPPLDPTLDINIDGDTTVCSGDCVTVSSLTVYYNNGASSATIAIDNPNLTWDIPAGVTFVDGQLCGDIGTYTIGVTYLDECDSITEATGSVEITFELCCPPLDPTLDINIDGDTTVCSGDCVTVSSLTVYYNNGASSATIAIDNPNLTWDIPAGVTFVDGQLCGDIGTYTIGVTYLDECDSITEATGSVEITFELCCPPLDPTLDINIDGDTTVCSGDCVTVSSLTVYYNNGASSATIAIDNPNLTWDIPAGVTFVDGQLCGDIGTYTIGVTYLDECDSITEATGSVEITFELCCPPLDPTLDINIDGDTTVCSGDCVTVSSLTVYYNNGASSATIAIDNPNLTWDIPAGVTFVDGQLCGDIGTYTIGVTYLDECDSITEATGSVEITFELCCPPLDPTLDINIDGDTTVCSGDCVTVSSLTVYYNNGASSATIAIDNPNLTWDIPAGVTFVDGQLCGDIGTYTIGVTYLDECDSITEATGSVEITFELCCIEPIIDLLEFRVKLPSNGAAFENWTNMFGYVYSTEPDKANLTFDAGTSYYDINTGEHGTPKFGFKVVAACDTLDLQYNWYRGDNCTADWLEYDTDTANWYTLSDGRVVPGWRDILIGGVYPISDSENSLCNQGGNILVIKVTGDTGIVQIYRIDINRVVPVVPAG